jgi:hypothetical protein
VEAHIMPVSFDNMAVKYKNMKLINKKYLF